MPTGRAIPTAVTTRGCGIRPGIIRPSIPGTTLGTIPPGTTAGTTPGIMTTAGVGAGAIPITTILTTEATMEVTTEVIITAAPAITAQATQAHWLAAATIRAAALVAA